MTAPLSLGIDIGGTFTDLVIHDPRDGRAVIWKESTTPDDPARGALRGHAQGAGEGGGEARADRPRRPRHDAVHQRADRAQGRQDRPADHGGLPRRAGDRPRAQVRALRPLHRDAQAAGAAAVAPRGHGAAGARRLGRDRRSTSMPRWPRSPTWWSRASKASPSASCTPTPIPRTNAPSARRSAERFQNLSISLSSDIAPEIREYLRASTTVANAYVRPLAEIYLERLEQALRDEGIPGGLFLMLSNGGLTHVERSQARAGAAAGKRSGRRRAGRRVVRPQRRARARARLRHGRHDRQACPGRRRRAAGRVRLRGGAREAVSAWLRPADPDRHRRVDRDRRRRRLDRATSRSSAR